MLRAEHIEVAFGGVRAVQGVTVEVGDEMLGLVGPNGSGKTTFLNALCGVVPSSGTITVDGRRVRNGQPRAAWRAGIARVFQAPQTFGDLSCLDNVLLSSSDRSLRGIAGAWLARPAMWPRERRRWERARRALETVGLEQFAREEAGMLTYGQQRLLELARAMAGDPKILLLDEPSAGLNDAETAELAALLRQLREGGLAMLVIDHKVDFLDAICDRIVVLELGRVIAEGSPETVWEDPQVIRAYLGVSNDAAR